MSGNEIQEFAREMFNKVMEYNKRILLKDEQLTFDYVASLNYIGIRNADITRRWLFNEYTFCFSTEYAERLKSDLDKFVNERYGAE